MTAFKGLDRVTRAAGESARQTMLPRAAAFWLAAGVLFLLFYAAAAPSPLYGVYQAQIRARWPGMPAVTTSAGRCHLA